MHKKNNYFKAIDCAILSHNYKLDSISKLLLSDNLPKTTKALQALD